MSDQPVRSSVRTATLCIALLSVGYAGAQTPSLTGVPAPSLSESRFDVVSIRRSAEGAPVSSRFTPTGGAMMTNISVFQLIVSSYPPFPAPPKGVPQWTLKERYDITATASLPTPPTQEQQQLMMRTMLMDRFRFVARIERTEQPAFDLVLSRSDGKLGPGITPTVDCAAVRKAEQTAREVAAAAGERPPAPQIVGRTDPLPACFGLRWGNRILEGDFTMAALAAAIQSAAGRPVVDKTGLQGLYRVKLEAEGLMATGLSATAAPSNAPSIFSALPDQLGFMLESSRAMVETLIVDRIERPSEN